jgi:putative membrane protein
MSYPRFAILTLMCSGAMLFAADSAPLAKQDADFVQKATVLGLAEVASSEAALKRGVISPEERKFAQKMVDDHTSVNKELASIASAKGIVLPQVADKDATTKLEKINATADKDFAEYYLESQISDHKDAIDLFEEQSKDGKDQELKAFAGKHLPHLLAHLETAKALEAKH